MIDSRSQRLARAVAALRLQGKPIASRDWSKAPGPYEEVTRQLVDQLADRVEREASDTQWLHRLIVGALVIDVVSRVIR